jgi:nicotinamidase-related amidase
MSPLPGLAKRSEKGLLTPDNCLVAFIDLQPCMLADVANFSPRSVQDNHLLLARAARLFGVPTVLTCVDTPAAPADMPAALLAVFPGTAPLLRTAINSWDDAGFVDLVTGTGRPKLLLAGLWTETGVALPAIQALADGYDVYIVEDCCGDTSALAHDNAMQRMLQAGATPVTARSVLLEWQRDWALLDTGDAVRAILHDHTGAPGPAHAPCPPARAVPQPVFPGYVADALR